MITPAFELSQDGQFLTLVVRVPYTRTSEFDLFMDGTDLKFYAKPYFLRLTLPGRIVEDGRETATFDIDKGLFTLRVPKASPGDHFEGLQMLTSLLAPKGSRSAGPLVEDISVGEDCPSSVSSEAELASLQKYGFGNQRAGVFARLQEELGDVIDFSPDHYLSDLFEDHVVQGLLEFSPWWTTLSPSPEAVCFTDAEKDQLRRFTNRSYLLDKASRRAAWLGLVESPWTIRKLSGTLCWLETCSSLQEVLVMFGRRVLCYPLYRHFDLVTAAIGDVVHILQSGKACVLKSLLDVHRVFRQNDPAYILNDLYITDYCIWTQRVE
ncbi:hypothetical protein NHX12_030761 [Muraenolepis orangiensis]|uniref:Protein SHQ1 homolog n=1 Tax=Muraenolepis orangiensis TaxID=630683 RepID=A0A9Q0EEL6_9TELE|nr:hypothetical protein NHX12_030761 [Muraenolepis orangiensis]